MGDRIYSTKDLEPAEGFEDEEELYQEVLTGLGNVDVGDDRYYVKRRHLKGFEVEVASYHILDEIGVDTPKSYYLPDEGLTFTENDEGYENLDRVLSSDDYDVEIDEESLKNSIASKILLGDIDIVYRNFLVGLDDGKVVPIDYELSGTGDEKRIEVKTRTIIREMEPEFSYEDVVERAEELYDKEVLDNTYFRLKENNLYGNETEDIYEHMKKVGLK